MVTEGEKQDLQRKLELKSDALTAYVKDDSEEITKLRDQKKVDDLKMAE